MSVFPEDISRSGHVVDELFVQALWLTGVTFLIIVGLLVYFMIAFAARPGRKAKYMKGDSRAAVKFTLAFSLAVFFIIDVNLAWSDHHAFAELAGVRPDEKESLVIRVMAKQFEWNFRYAGNDGVFADDNTRRKNDDITSGQLVIPKNKNIILVMQSKDVVHSLFLPNFRLKQDLVPGLTTQMWFEAVKTTAEARRVREIADFDYEIACAELCGLQHTAMKSTIRILEPDEFARWHKEKSDTAGKYRKAAVWKSWQGPAKKQGSATKTEKK